MTRPRRTGAEQARNQLPSLIDDAAKGRTTIITRHGRSVAAIVPVDALAPARKQKGLIELAGSGKGLWGRDSRKWLRQLREEWNR